MIKNKKMMEAIEKAPQEVRRCLQDSMERVMREEERGGRFASVDEFIDRMLAADMDVHAFTIIGQYIPMTFPGNGDVSMVRAILALRGFDPDYSVAPEIKVFYRVDDNQTEDDLPFD